MTSVKRRFNQSNFQIARSCKQVSSRRQDLNGTISSPREETCKSLDSLEKFNTTRAYCLLDSRQRGNVCTTPPREFYSRMADLFFLQLNFISFPTGKYHESVKSIIFFLFLNITRSTILLIRLINNIVEKD